MLPEKYSKHGRYAFWICKFLLKDLCVIIYNKNWDQFSPLNWPPKSLKTKYLLLGYRIRQVALTLKAAFSFSGNSESYTVNPLYWYQRLDYIFKLSRDISLSSQQFSLYWICVNKQAILWSYNGGWKVIRKVLLGYFRNHK